MTRVASDPRTWASFSHIGLRGFRKVECETPLESLTTAAGLGLAILGTFFIWGLYVQAILGNPAQTVELVGDWRPVAMFVAGLGLMAVRLLTDNFYLIDPAGDAVYLHVKVGPFRSVRRVGSIL